MDIKAALRREHHLNLISYTIILTLVGVVALLVYLLLNGMGIPPLAPLSSGISRTLLTGFLLMVVVYLSDQHRRLRAELIESHQQLEAARGELQSSYDRLAFAHYSASLMSSLAQEEDGIAVVLEECATHFDADVAAVVGDDVKLFCAPGITPIEANSQVMRVALEAVRVGRPLQVSSLDEEEGQAIAVPLRVMGSLKSVACLWRRTGEFKPDQLDGLSLIGRMMELSVENRELLAEVEQQLDGTLHVLQSLVEDRRPEYLRHARSVAELAVPVGRALGMNAAQLKDLKLAALLHDVGMVRLPRDLADPDSPLSTDERQLIKTHTLRGAEVARDANLGLDVQQGILTHHERLDGSGYPYGLEADRIPLAGKILAVCEVYDSIAHRSYHGAPSSASEAAAELRRNAGVLYDARAVQETLKVAGTPLRAGSASGPQADQRRPSKDHAYA